MKLELRYSWLNIASVLHTSLIIDVCIDIYVMMSSDLYGTCRHCLYGTLSCMRRCNCNPFGNMATVTASCQTLHWWTMQTSFTTSVISFIYLMFLLVDFDGDHVRDNINFVIKRIKVHTDTNGPGYKFPGKLLSSQ